MTVEERQHARVIVCAGSFADALRSIAMAAGLASWARADLKGVLVEEEQAVQTEGARAARAVTAFGSEIDSPDAKTLRSLLSADARAFEAELERCANAQTCAWSFERHRGDIATQSLEVLTQDTIVLIGYRRLHAHASTVLAICPSQGGDGQALRLATALARQLNADVTPVFIGGLEAGPGSAGPDPFALKRQTGVRVNRPLLFSSVPQMLAALNRMSAVAIVTEPGVGPLRSAAELRQLRDVARCPILLLGVVGMPEMT